MCDKKAVTKASSCRGFRKIGKMSKNKMPGSRCHGVKLRSGRSSPFFGKSWLTKGQSGGRAGRRANCWPNLLLMTSEMSIDDGDHVRESSTSSKEVLECFLVQKRPMQTLNRVRHTPTLSTATRRLNQTLRMVRARKHACDSGLISS
jgi:hypothetical protein